VPRDKKTQKHRERKTGIFTDRYIKTLRPEFKMYQVREGRGFAIRVLPSGVKTWYYVYQINGKRRQLNLGNYPDTTLEDAHAAYRNAYGLVRKGQDPQGRPPGEQGSFIDPEKLTVTELSLHYIEHIKGHLVPRSVLQQNRTLHRDVIPQIGAMLASKVSRRDAIYLVESVAKRAPGQARNVLKTARSMFAYALTREFLGHNPFSGVGRAVPVIAPRERNRRLSESEIISIWKKLIGHQIGQIILLVLVTGQRPGEVAGMRWTEIAGLWWTIPMERTKNGRENSIYLSFLAKTLLPRQIEGEDCVFPAQGRGRGITAEGSTRPGTLSHFLTNNNYLGLPRWTPHDLRRTMSTFMAKLGCRDEIIDEILNHKKRGVIRVYNLHRYDREKRHWLIIWARFIQKNVRKLD